MNSSNIDTVESDISAWTPSTLTPVGKGVDAKDVWSRELYTATNHRWHGIDAGANSDTALESPSLDVSAVDPLIITVKQTYSFETSGSPVVYWDGGLALHGATVQAGVLLEHVKGQAWCRGLHNGDRLVGVRGNLLLEEASRLGTGRIGGASKRYA